MKHLFPALDLKRYTHAHDENGACEAITHGTATQFLGDKCCNLFHLCVQKAGAVASMACFAWPPLLLQLPFTLLPRETIVFDNLAEDHHTVKWGRGTHSVSTVRALEGGYANPLGNKRGKKRKSGPNNRILGFFFFWYQILFDCCYKEGHWISVKYIVFSQIFSICRILNAFIYKLQPLLNRITFSYWFLKQGELLLNVGINFPLGLYSTCATNCGFLLRISSQQNHMKYWWCLFLGSELCLATVKAMVAASIYSLWLWDAQECILRLLRTVHGLRWDFCRPPDTKTSVSHYPLFFVWYLCPYLQEEIMYKHYSSLFCSPTGSQTQEGKLPTFWLNRHCTYAATAWFTVRFKVFKFGSI